MIYRIATVEDVGVGLSALGMSDESSDCYLDWMRHMCCQSYLKATMAALYESQNGCHRECVELSVP